jgi:hypothetical protein
MKWNELIPIPSDHVHVFLADPRFSEFLELQRIYDALGKQIPITKAVIYFTLGNL